MQQRAGRRPKPAPTRLRDLLRVGGQPDQAPLHRVRGVRLHQRARLGKAAGPAGAAPRGGGRARARPAGAGAARPRPADRCATPKPASSCWSTRTTPGFRKRFARIAAQREAELREALVRAGVDALELSTDADLVDAIVRFADMRKRRTPAVRRRQPAGAPEARRLSTEIHHALPLARIPLAAAGAAAAGAAVRAGCCGARRSGAALCLAVDRARRRWAPARACAATSRRCCSCWRWPRCCWPRRGRWRWSRCRRNQQTIILAMDVSGSMRATDVQPNRLVAAQNAAKAFLAELPRHVKVGIVAFAGSAQVAQLPTREPRRPGHRHRPLPAAARHGHRQRHRDLAGHAVPRCRHRPAVACRPAATASAASRIDRRQEGEEGVHAGGAGLLHLGRDHHADRRPAHHRRRPAGSRQDGRRPRRARLHGGHRHGGRRDHRLRGLVDARAAGRGDAQGRSPTRRQAEYFYAGTAAGPEEGLRDAQLEADGGEEGDRDLRRCSRWRPRRWRCCRPGCRCSGSTGSFDSHPTPCARP